MITISLCDFNYMHRKGYEKTYAFMIIAFKFKYMDSNKMKTI